MVKNIKFYVKVTDTVVTEKQVPYVQFRTQVVWKGSKCSHTSICIMEDSHILNCLRILESYNSSSLYYGVKTSEWVHIFNTELKYRKAIERKLQANHKLTIATKALGKFLR